MKGCELERINKIILIKQISLPLIAELSMATDGFNKKKNQIKQFKFRNAINLTVTLNNNNKNVKLENKEIS